MKKYTIKLFVLLLLSAAIVLASACKSAPSAGSQQGPNGSSAPLTVKVLDIGQGDSILIQTPQQVVLVDTGDVGTKDKLVSYIKKLGITKIDKVVITHPHADHLGGMSAVMDSFPIAQIFDSGFATTTGMYRQYLSAAQKKKIPFSVLQAGGEVDLGDGMLLKVLAPEKPFISGSDSDVNNNSVVLKLVYGDFSMLLTGDAETESEERMLRRFGPQLKSRILKSGHHGSRSSSSPAFLKAVGPEAVVISVGVNNDYHHPHPSVMKRYNDNKLAIFRTDQHGTVTITSDGKSYKIAKEK